MLRLIFYMANIDQKSISFKALMKTHVTNYGEDLEKSSEYAFRPYRELVYEVIGNWVWISGETKEQQRHFKGNGAVSGHLRKKQWF
ncbi:hypothetical protein LAD67_17730 [Escherichia coli]|nr:hypothetical protein [Escherichia coli]